MYVFDDGNRRIVKFGPETQVEIPNYGKYDLSSSNIEPLNGNWYSSYDFFRWVYANDQYPDSTSWNGWNGRLLAFYFDDQYIFSLRVGYINHDHNDYIWIGFRYNSSQYGGYSQVIRFDRDKGLGINFYAFYRVLSNYKDDGSTPYMDKENGIITTYDELWPTDLLGIKDIPEV